LGKFCLSLHLNIESKKILELSLLFTCSSQTTVTVKWKLNGHFSAEHRRNTRPREETVPSADVLKLRLFFCRLHALKPRASYNWTCGAANPSTYTGNAGLEECLPRTVAQKSRILDNGKCVERHRWHTRSVLRPPGRHRSSKSYWLRKPSK
jgi:hypothetical protein